MSFSYNTRIIDYGNGEKRVVTYKKAVKLLEDEEKEFYREEREKKKTDNKEKKERTEKEIEHSKHTSMNRTKNTVYNLARANKWDYFATFTFAPDKVEDRTDLDALSKKIRKWLSNLKLDAPELMYLLIPEQHKRYELNMKHAWHFHALLANIPNDWLDVLDPNEVKIAAQLYPIIVYSINKFKLGFTTLTKVTSNDKVSNYIAKYITKSLSETVDGRNRYFVSQNVKKPKETFFMCKTSEYMNFKQENNDEYQRMNSCDLYLENLIDSNKIVYSKSKQINVEGYENEYHYLELRDDETDIERYFGKFIIKKNN